jgi:DMSO/TMAO reductase YedYZ molybdopterin-dependent catalytic subunit
MNTLISRRRLMKTLLATAAGGAGMSAAAGVANRYGLIPPDYGGIYGPGETLTYASHRLLMARGSMAREFSRADISRTAPMNGKPPEGDVYEGLLKGGFADWRLAIDGLVARPMSFSLAELKGQPSSTQITHLACEEGWSFIAEWTGVPLSHVLGLAGVLPQARYVVYFSIDPGWWDSIDMPEAWHPQTLLTYGMNGQELPTGHGAPLRLRVPRQLGYKSVKHLSRITVTDSLKSFGQGLGSPAPEVGYSWYAGI